MNSLKIDTSDNLKTRVELIISDKKFLAEKKREKPGEQNVLELAEQLLRSQNLLVSQIDSIDIQTGPGSFTGLRVGVSIANAFGFGLNISVNGKPIGDIITPKY